MQQKETKILKLLKSNKATQREQGFTELMYLYQKNVYYQIRRILNNHHDTNDVVQDVFIKIWQNIDKFKGESTLKSWIYRIAYNQTISYIRQKKLRGYQTLTLTDTHQSPADFLEAPTPLPNNIQGRLRQLVSELPLGQQMVFNLKYYEDLPYKQIAEITNLSEGALKSHYHLAVKKITEKIKQND